MHLQHNKHQHDHDHHFITNPSRNNERKIRGKFYYFFFDRKKLYSTFKREIKILTGTRHKLDHNRFLHANFQPYSLTLLMNLLMLVPGKSDEQMFLFVIN